MFDLTALPRPAILASFASNILNLALPLVVLQIYDRIIPNQSLETLIVLISAVVVVVTL
ncbi:MAG: ABC transporter permease, partial [Rhizobiales bacterium]|nr:ABC transporter permease [Hyphomicrobiales bacterium]